MDAEFTHGTVAIDKEGVLTDTLLCGEGKVKVTVVIPRGVLGDYTSFRPSEALAGLSRRARPRRSGGEREVFGAADRELHDHA